MGSESVLSKQEAVKELSKLVRKAEKLMAEAITFAEKHDVQYENEDGQVFEDENEENEELYNTRAALLRWNSSSCW